MSKQIDQATLAILSRVTVDGNTILLTCGQLDRKQYQAVNAVLENMGGKWNRKAKGHIFASDPTLPLEQVILSGEIEPPKNYGCFFTPKRTARYVVELANIQDGHKVLEPSTGHGAIADEVPRCAAITCIEFLPANISVLWSKGYRPVEADFLSIKPVPGYDRVVMNPPFSYDGHPQADIDHVTHAFEFLKTGGRLVSIMSAGIQFRENKKTVAFREMVERNGWIERLQDKTFKESGTNVNTCVVVMDNPS